MEKEKDEFNKYDGFRLLSISFIKNDILGDLQYEFVDQDDKQDSFYSTLILGANGTGKSNLFRIIIELFWELNELKKTNGKTQSKQKFGFALTYSLHGYIFHYSNIYEIQEYKSENKEYGEKEDTFSSGNAYLTKNNEIIEFEDAEFPESILAISIMITDKYPFPDAEKFKIYQYLGSKYSPQLASTKTYIRRIVDFVSRSINSTTFKEGVREVMKEFNFPLAPCFTFYTQNTTRFFNGKLTQEGMSAYYDEIEKKYKEKTTKPPFKLNYYNSNIKKDPKLENEIIEFCNKLKNENSFRGFPRSSKKAIDFNLLVEPDIKKLTELFYLLNHMISLGIVYAPTIEFLKLTEQNNTYKLSGYTIENSSSGEFNLLGTMFGLMGSIKPNSLIFIDEPEVSMHPSWQMKYNSFLRKIFSENTYSTCHFLIASHSHFLVSDLDGRYSKLIGLRRREKIEIIDLPENIDTFGWSPDDILYNVFDVISSRNKFVAEDIANILDKLSKGNKEGVNKIEKETYNTLIHLKQTLKDNDPLKEVVKSILKKVN